MRRLLLLLLVPLFAACWPFIVADGAFRVSGEVVTSASAPPQCLLRLLSPQRRDIPLQTIPISGRFLETFMVAPTRETYIVEVFCDGKPIRVVSLNYGTDVTYAVPIDLGRLVL